MASSDNLYKRDEDQKWREKVNDRLAGLTTDTLLSQDRIEDLEENVRQIEELLEGKPSDKMDNGLKGDYHDLDTRVNRLWAVIFMDAAGEQGLFEEWRKLKRKESWRLELLRFWGPIIIAAITTAGLLLSEWPKLKAWLPSEKPDKLSTMIAHAKRPPNRGRRVVARHVPAPAEEAPDEPAAEEVP